MSSRPRLHPLQALYGAHERAAGLPVVDHYAGVEARMRKALELQGSMADDALFDVTLDLEDGAPVGGEAEQAQLVAELVMSPANRFGRVGARIHPLHHACFRPDLETLIGRAGERLAYVMVPKVRNAAELADAAALIRRTCLAHGVSRRLPVHALVETHGALHEVFALAALPAVESLSFGLMDFVSAHHGAIPAPAMAGIGQFRHPLVQRAKLEIAAACHAAGKVASHCVVTEFKDERLLADAARQAARELGFARMWSIHPNQIRPILAAFAPDPDEVEIAGEILLTAQEADWGPTAHRGALQDRASYRYHWHVLERASRTGRVLPEPVRAAFFPRLARAAAGAAAGA